VLALVGLRKAMDFFPSIFSQKDLKYLDNLMPEKQKKKKKKNKKAKGTPEVILNQSHKQYLTFVFRRRKH
jgi:hypothetical protein